MVEGRENIPAASAAYLNHALEPTPTASAPPSLRLSARLKRGVRFQKVTLVNE